MYTNVYQDGDSPMKDREAILQELADSGQEMQRYLDAYEAKNEAWWNGLTQEEREDAFYAVVKRIYEGEIKQRGSYRYVLYNVFGFDAGMYLKGMECGYMALHNSIMDDEQFAEANMWMLSGPES